MEKGKGRAMDSDYAQLIAPLSLSEYDDSTAPRNNLYSSSYTSTYGSSYEPPYTSDEVYTHIPTQSSSAAYGGATSYSSSYPTTSSSSYTGYDTASVTSSSAPSYGGGSTSGWSDAYTPASVLSGQSASHRIDVNNTICRQRPPRDVYTLPCEFRYLTGCERVFPGDEEQGWIDHIEGHLQSKFPGKLICWFCSDHFDARDMFSGDVRSNFNARMHHIRAHFVYDNSPREQMRTDEHLLQHLLEQRLLDRRTYEIIANIPRVVMEGIFHEHHRRRKPLNRAMHHSHLPQVEEEVVAMSSSRPHPEHKPHVKLPGTKPAQHNHRSKRARRNRDDPGELITTPTLDPPEEVVPKAPVQTQSLPHPSLEFWKDILLERFKTWSIHDTSKSSEDQSIGYTGGKTAADPAATVSQWIRRIYAEFLRESSHFSSRKMESSQSQEHSSDGQSSGPTDTPSPDSDSLWLAEYSEDEEAKLDEDHPAVQFTELDAAILVDAFRSWRENLPEGSIPCDGVDRSNSAPDHDKGKGKDSATGKRTLADQSKVCDNATDSNGPLSELAGSGKRRRTSERKLTFACPYTKKDLMSHKGCCKYTLSRIRDVKQHLSRCHRRPPYCARCMGTFETEGERDGHIREASCSLRPPSELDGVTGEQRHELRKKSAPSTSPEAQWFVIFDILFPDYKPKPRSPYVDKEILQVITPFLDFATARGPEILSEVLNQREAINGERDLAAYLRVVVEVGLSSILDEWFARGSSSTQDSDVPSNSEENSQGTPTSTENSRERVSSTSAHEAVAVSCEAMSSLPEGGPMGALPNGQDIAGNSADPFSFGEGMDADFGFEHEDFNFPAGLTYDGSDDELMQLLGDTQGSSSFQPDLGTEP